MVFKSWWFRLFAPLSIVVVIAGMVIAQSFHLSPSPSPAWGGGNVPAISEEALLSAPASFRGAEIQRVLEKQGSPLVRYQEIVGEQSLPASELFWIASQGENYGLNPKALLTTFSIQNNGLVWSQNGGLLAYLQEMAAKLGGLLAEHQDGVMVESSPAAADSTPTGAMTNTPPVGGTGAKSLPTVTTAAVPVLSPGGSAAEVLGRYLAPEAKLAGQVRGSVQAWGDTYQRLFGESAQAKTMVSSQKATDIPFLRLPFDQPANDFWKVESFFDHAYPGYFNKPNILRLDGLNLPGAQFKTCWSGMTCYAGHNGLDFPMPTGTPILAAAPGKVILRYDYEGGVILDHGNGYRTIYWHMDKIVVTLDQQVSDGQLLGYSGNRGMSTGPHLHFVLRLSALSRDVDPYGWWAPTRDPWPFPSRWMWRGGPTADNRSNQSQLFYMTYWNREARGFAGDSWWTRSTDGSIVSTNFGIWGTYLPQTGNYRVFAYWPKSSEATTSASYQVWHSKGVSNVMVSQRGDGDRWVPLGTFAYEKGSTAVILTDRTRDNPRGARVYFDAVKWEPAGGNLYIPEVSK